MAIRPFLKDRLLLERPLGGARLLPFRVGPDDGGGLAKIRLVVGSEIKSGTLPRHRGGGGEEFGLHDAVLVVAPLGPRVGEKDEDRVETGARRHRRQEIIGVSPDKMKVREPGALALALGPRNPVGRDVYPDAARLRVRLGVGCEKMTMAAADLPYEARRWRDDLKQRNLERAAPLGDPGVMLQFPGGPQAAESPSLPASIATMRRLMSVGFTPLIRLAWPSVRGFI
jgi:hypothetical protein